MLTKIWSMTPKYIALYLASGVVGRYFVAAFLSNRLGVIRLRGRTGSSKSYVLAKISVAVQISLKCSLDRIEVKLVF